MESVLNGIAKQFQWENTYCKLCIYHCFYYGLLILFLLLFLVHHYTSSVDLTYAVLHNYCPRIPSSPQLLALHLLVNNIWEYSWLSFKWDACCKECTTSYTPLLLCISFLDVKHQSLSEATLATTRIQKEKFEQIFLRDVSSFLWAWEYKDHCGHMACKNIAAQCKQDHCGHNGHC